MQVLVGVAKTIMDLIVFNMLYPTHRAQNPHTSHFLCFLPAARPPISAAAVTCVRRSLRWPLLAVSALCGRCADTSPDRAPCAWEGRMAPHQLPPSPPFNPCQSPHLFIPRDFIPGWKGVSTVLKNKRSEITNRERAFAELGLKAAISVETFNQMDVK